MSLFQCAKCGCCENTALTNAGNAYFNNHRLESEGVERPALATYRVVLGLPPGAEFGAYCSACTPFWYTEKGNFGIGPNPTPEPGEGLWHGKFERKFYPLGSMKTNREGNLMPTDRPEEKS